MRFYVLLFLSWLTASVALASFYAPPRSITFPMRQAGEAFMWGGSTCPTGTVAMDGTSYLRAGTYASLFAQLSTTYGAADGTHFNVPNAKGVFIRGAGSQTISSVGYTGTRGTSERDQFTQHHHAVWGGPSGSIGTQQSLGNAAVQVIAGFSSVAGGQAYQNSLAGSSAQILQDSGSGTETKPANIVMLYCIVY